MVGDIKLHNTQKKEEVKKEKRRGVQVARNISINLRFYKQDTVFIL